MDSESAEEEWIYDFSNSLQAIRNCCRETKIRFRALEILNSKVLDEKSEEELMSKIERENEELISKKELQLSDDEVLEQLFLTKTMQRMILDEVSAGEWCVPRDPETVIQKQILRVLNKLMALSKETAQMDQSNRQLESEIYELRKTKQSLRENELLLVNQLKEMQKRPMRPADLEPELLEELTTMENNMKQLNFVFQRLVHASGINWADDDRLLSALLRNGQHATLQISSNWPSPQS